ncbi:lauroyl-Kdo(2)-lipid IV(A) myristoyltransferase [Ferrimonas futtsuensis]|uniref:lauroyl-Kdo(2)-lipid IV(A) myristoyltransferase n=1 Tax=Ferrimonas futtsuensis TaxID=364764 RepID=UPI00040E57E6|nr:lauroyl-Kdo(2)-lipid IV(A) myristoyltransferase [Ferrimonas futtsuensis]
MSLPISPNQPYRVEFCRSMLSPKYWPSWLAVGMMVLLAYLPHRVRYWMARGLARVIRPFCKKPFRIARANLGACFPDMSEAETEAILKKMMFNFSLVGLSMGVLAVKSRKHLEKHIAIKGLEHIERARDQGKPIVFLVPHLWGIEYAGARLSSWGLPMMGMVKHHKNPVFNWLSVRQRCRFGGTVYHRDAGLRTLVQGLRRGESFFYLPDQDHGPEKSIFADFFATQKATLPVIGRLANCGGATVLPLTIGIDKERGNMTMEVFEALDLGTKLSKEAEASLLNHQLERLIGAHPEQYMWFLKVLHTRPEGAKLLYR